MGGLVLQHLSLICCSPSVHVVDPRLGHNGLKGKKYPKTETMSPQRAEPSPQRISMQQEADEESRHPKFPADKASQGQQQRPSLCTGD